jgi:NAD(P)-dependent dehydrogenase (short-subunit alcohol dehydrogenase family)
LSIELGPNFEPLYFDVTDEEAARKAADVVREKLHGQKLSCLVNNAGEVLSGVCLLDIAWHFLACYLSP